MADNYAFMVIMRTPHETICMSAMVWCMQRSQCWSGFVKSVGGHEAKHTHPSKPLFHKK